MERGARARGARGARSDLAGREASAGEGQGRGSRARPPPACRRRARARGTHRDGRVVATGVGAESEGEDDESLVHGWIECVDLRADGAESERESAGARRARAVRGARCNRTGYLLTEVLI